MSGADIVVDQKELEPGGIVLTEAAAHQLGGGLPVGAGDAVVTPGGVRNVLAIVSGDEARGWCSDGTGHSWALAVHQRATDGLRKYATGADRAESYHPVMHTPLGGFPVRDAHLDWLEARGAWHVRDEIAWRQDHRTLAASARGARLDRGRTGTAWRALQSKPELGIGPIREGLQALARVLGFELVVSVDGVRLGLMHRRPPSTWSKGPITTAGAFRHGDPAPGGVHDPLLVGDEAAPCEAHIPLPCGVLPRHLEGWVAGLVDRRLTEVRRLARQEGVEALRDELQEALEHRAPRPVAIDGTPLRADDFLWTWVPVLPAAFRQPRMDGNRRFPHGVDGSLHALVSAVRKVDKLGGVEGVEPPLRRTLRGRVADAVDQHLGWSLDSLQDGSPDAWGWSIALDFRETLGIDGVMLDWGAVAVAVVDPGRERVGVPRSAWDLMLDQTDGDAVALTTLPDGIVVVRPEPVDGPVVLLPEATASALDVRTGGSVRVLPMVSRCAQAELDAIEAGLRLSVPPRVVGWLDEAAAAEPRVLLAQLASWARIHAHDRCAGPVGRRTFGGIVAPPVGTPGDEVRQVQRSLHALEKMLDDKEPQTTLARGLSAGRMVEMPELRAEVRALFTAHDGQEADGEPLWQLESRAWRFVPFDADSGPAIGRDAAGGLLLVRDDGRVSDGSRVVAGSLSALLHESLLARLA